MDWTAWLGLVVFLGLWVFSGWFFSAGRRAERLRRRDPDQADAIIDAERQSARGHAGGSTRY